MSFVIYQETLLPSAARTATQNLPDLFSPDQFGLSHVVEVVLDLTAFVTAASLTLRVQEWDPGKADWVDVLVSTALTAVGIRRLVLGPLVVAAANVAATWVPAPRWRVVVTHGNANSHTYSVSLKRLVE